MPEKRPKSTAGVESLQKALDALGAQVAALSERLERLEAAGLATSAAALAPVAEPLSQPVGEPVAAQSAAAEAVAAEPVQAEPVKEADQVSEELLLVLSAAVAAYLGKRPHIRAVRLLGSSAWAQQGRVFVQASHQLNVPHDA